MLLSGCGEKRTVIQGTNIQDLISQNKIKISFYHADIEKIVVKVNNRRLRPFRIWIPTGTILSPNDRNYQNMLCYMDVSIKVDLLASDIELEIPVVCTNISKKIPESGLEFNFHKQSENNELNLFIEKLSRMDIKDIESITRFDTPTYGVMQSAVWIIADNADYNELGTLVNSGQTIYERLFRTPAGERILGTLDIAAAMVLLKKCGVDIESKRIWNDRFYIYKENLQEGTYITSMFKSLIDNSN
jgi:hypothetical protein